MALMSATDAKGETEAQNHVVFLEDFFDELRRKLARRGCHWIAVVKPPYRRLDRPLPGRPFGISA